MEPEEMTQKQEQLLVIQLLVIPLPKKRLENQQLNMSSQKSHAPNLTQPTQIKAEELLSEEQAWFGPGRNTMKQILNCSILTEKHLEHQKELFHNFIDLKKAFDRVWHKGRS